MAGETDEHEISRALRHRCMMGGCSFLKYNEDEKGEVITSQYGWLDLEEVRKMGFWGRGDRMKHRVQLQGSREYGTSYGTFRIANIGIINPQERCLFTAWV